METLIIAIVGCVTGCCSLMINIIRFWKERFSIKVMFPSGEAIYFERPSSHKTRTNYQGVIYIRFVNKSSFPITISDVDISIDSEYYPRIPFDYPLRILDIKTKSKVEVGKISFDDELVFPLRLESNDAKEGKIFLRFLPDDMSETNTVHLKIHTAKKSIKTSVNIIPFT